jgi:hypothetical protein
MAQTILASDLFVTGNVSANSISLPSGSVDDSAVSASTKINYQKLQHQSSFCFNVPPATTIVASTQLIHLCLCNTSLIAVQVMTTVPPTASDTVVVNVLRGNTTTAYTTVLTAPITLDNSTVAKTPYSGTITSPTALSGDSYEIVITIPVTNTSCKGIMVMLWTVER